MRMARYIAVAELLAKKIGEHLKVDTPKAVCERRYALTLDDFDVRHFEEQKIQLRVFVIPDEPKFDILTRSRDQADYAFHLVCFERHAAGTDPFDNAWVDRRVLIVDGIRREFGDLRKPLAGDFAGLRVEEFEYSVFVDEPALREERAFWSELRLVLRETVIE